MAEKVLERLIHRFEAAEEASRDSRDKSERDRDYFLGKQWTPEETKKIQARGQPVITINRIRRKIEFIRGAEIQTRTRPQALPRNPDDEDAAHAATDAIRFVCDNNDYNRIRSKVRQDFAVEGTGAIEISIVPKEDDVKISLRRIPWDRFFYDPHSSEDDFSDAMYMGEVVWMDFDRAQDRFPKKLDALMATMNVSVDETFGDKPASQIWADKKRRRVRVVQMNFLAGDRWMSAIFTKGGILSGPTPIPFVDSDGRSVNPIEAQSLYVDRDNDRHGIVRDMISPQEEINKRRSKALHMMNVRQFRRSPGAGGSLEQTRKELARPDGGVTASPGDFEILPTGDMALAQFQLLQEAKEEIDGMGPNATLQGKQEQKLSGRAIQATQQGGMVELTPYLDAGDSLDKRVYIQIWDRIRQYWTAEKWIRVTDDENNVKFVGLNRPVTFGQAFVENLQEQKVPPEQIEQQVAEARQDPQFASMFDEVMEVRNNTAEIVVDIVIEKGPDLPTIQAEQFEQLASMANAGIPIPPDVIIEASSLRNKEEILDRMRGTGDQEPDPLQQAAVQLELEDKAADVEEKKSKALLNQAKASSELVE